MDEGKKIVDDMMKGFGDMSMQLMQIQIQFKVKGHLITLSSVNPEIFMKVEKIKRIAKQTLKTDGVV